MTTAKEVLQRADAEDIELIRLVFVNNSGVPRGRVVDYDGLESAFDEGANVTHAMQSFNALDRLVAEGKYGPAGEVRIVPDPETFTVVPYDERAAVMLGSLHSLDGEPWAAGPRARLETYLAELGEEDYTADAAFESEYYYLRETDDGSTSPSSVSRR